MHVPPVRPQSVPTVLPCALLPGNQGGVGHGQAGADGDCHTSTWPHDSVHHGRASAMHLRNSRREGVARQSLRAQAQVRHAWLLSRTRKPTDGGQAAKAAEQRAKAQKFSWQ